MDGGLRAFQHFMDSGPGIWAWLLALAVLAPLVTALHEVGHALAARTLVAGDVLVVDGDERRPGLRFEVGGIGFFVSPFVNPVGRAGYCRYGERTSAREAAGIALAGPAATLAGLAAALLVVGHVHGAVRELVWMAVLLQAVATILCLVPMTLTTRDGRRERNDGMIALEALRAPQLREPVTVAQPAPADATSPRCRCGHRRDEHLEPATGGPGGCLGQDYDFQSLSAQVCDCGAFVATRAS